MHPKDRLCVLAIVALIWGCAWGMLVCVAATVGLRTAVVTGAVGAILTCRQVWRNL